MAPWTQLNTTEDVIFQYVAQTLNPHSSDLFTQENVVRAWTAVKQRFPLLGARIQLKDGCDALHFVVSERRLTELLPGELTFGAVENAEEVSQFIDDLIRGPQRSFLDLPARMYVLRRTGQTGLYHIVLNVSHVITDAVAQATLCRTFFDLLSSPSIDFVPDLENRLAMAAASEDLNPTLRMSKPRQKWRRAIAIVLLTIRQSKMQGGHTIPGVITPSTYRTPALKRNLSLVLPGLTSARVLETCRRYKFTFSAALHVISQLATARVLHRQYCRGKIAQVDWEWRKRQPMHFYGPVSLRPYLDPGWLRQGGGTEVCLSIDFFSCSLPFMPSFTESSTHPASGLSEDGAPPFSFLMSDARFILRCRAIKRQLNKIMTHPLFLDITEAGLHRSVARKKRTALRWRKALRGECNHEDSLIVGIAGDPLVYTLGISSIGNMDAVQPSEYPIPTFNPLSASWKHLETARPQYQVSMSMDKVEDVVLRIIDWETHVHVRPADFYLGSAFAYGQIKFLINWDANAYNDALVSEWFQELRNATLWYLDRKSDEESKL